MLYGKRENAALSSGRELRESWIIITGSLCISPVAITLHTLLRARGSILFMLGYYISFIIASQLSKGEGKQLFPPSELDEIFKHIRFRKILIAKFSSTF